MREHTRQPPSICKVKPHSSQNFGDKSELENLGDSFRQRQLSPFVAMLGGTLSGEQATAASASQ